MLRKVLRTMAEHKGRYIGAALLLIVSGMMFVMPNTVSVNLDAIFTRLSAESNLSDAEFSTSAPINVQTLAQRFSAQVELGGTADCEVEPQQTLRVFAAMETVNIPVVDEGHFPGGGEILLDRLFADTNSYHIGDTITVGGQPFTVSGYCFLPNYIYIIKSKDEMINDPSQFGVGVVGKRDFTELPNQTSTYAIRFFDREQLRTQEAAVKNTLRAEGVGIPSWQSTDRKINVSYVPMEIGVLSTVSIAIPFMMLALACILLGMLMWRMVKSESVIIGTLYAQGYRKGELRRHYLLFPLLIAVSGAVVGAILGTVLAEPMLRFMLTAFPMPFYGIAHQPAFALLAVLVPVIVLCSVTWLIVGRTLKAPPAELMKGGAKTDKVNLIERRLRLERLPFSWKFQIREQVRSLSRTSFLLLGVVVATMLILYGFTMKSSVDYMLRSGITEVYDFRYEYVYAESHTGTPPQGTEQFNAAYVTLADDDESEFYVTGVLPDTSRVRLKDADGSLLTLNQTIATATLAAKLGLVEGSNLAVYDTENGREHVMTVDRIADAYIGDFLFVPLSTFNAKWGLPEDTYVGLWSDTPMTFQPGEIASTKSIENIVRGFNALLNQMGPLVYGLIGAAFLLGLIIIYIVSGMVIDESRSTISLMKVMGYRRRVIGRLVLGSNTPVVILGYFLGVPVLLATAGAFFASLAGTLQFVIPIKLSIPYMLLGFIVVMISYELAKALCGKKVARIPMSEALKAGSE